MPFIKEFSDYTPVSNINIVEHLENSKMYTLHQTITGPVFTEAEQLAAF